MRDPRDLDRFRQTHVEEKAYGTRGNDGNGVFLVPSPVDGQPMTIIASNGGGWDHVSISRQSRTPSWTEIEHVFRLFFQNDEIAMQLHLPRADHIDRHPFCLHLWRPQASEIALPPKGFV